MAGRVTRWQGDRQVLYIVFASTLKRKVERKGEEEVCVIERCAAISGGFCTELMLSWGSALKYSSLHVCVFAVSW